MGTKHCNGLDRTYNDGGDDDNNTMLHLDTAGNGDDGGGDGDDGDDRDYDDDDGDDDGGDNVAPGHSRREELEDKLQCIQLSTLARTRVS